LYYRQICSDIIRESRYKGWVLVEKFKKEINGAIRQKLIKAEQSSRDIEQ